MFFFYISNFVYPKDLLIYNDWLINNLSFKLFYLPLIIDFLFFAIVICIGFFIKRKVKKDFPLFIFFLMWFILGMIPCFPIWLLDQTVASRWFYFPMFGLLGILGLLFINIKFNNFVKKVTIIILIITIIIFSVRIIIRNNNFQSRLILYSHDASIGNSPLLYKLLIQELINEGKYKDASVPLSKLINLNINDPESWYYKSIVDTYTGNYIQLKKDINKIINTPYDQNYFILLPFAQIKYETNYKEANRILQIGVKKYPHNLTLWSLLAYTEYKLGDNSAAAYASTQANTSLEAIVTHYSKLLNY
jgi:hypothetical protein